MASFLGSWKKGARFGCRTWSWWPSLSGFTTDMLSFLSFSSKATALHLDFDVVTLRDLDLLCFEVKLATALTTGAVAVHGVAHEPGAVGAIEHPEDARGLAHPLSVHVDYSVRDRDHGLEVRAYSGASGHIRVGRAHALDFQENGLASA